MLPIEATAVAASASHRPRNEDQCHHEHTQRGGEHGAAPNGQSEEYAHAQRVHEHHQRKHHGHQTRGQVLLGEVDADVVQAEQHDPLQRDPQMIAEAEAQALAAQQRIQQQHQRCESEAPGDRDHR
jgi:hypothetical protein